MVQALRHARIPGVNLELAAGMVSNCQAAVHWVRHGWGQARKRIRLSRDLDVSVTFVSNCPFLQILFKTRPYDPLSDMQAALTIADGRHPSIPTSSGPEKPMRKAVKEILCNICEQCWAFDPEERCDIGQILSEFDEKTKVHGIHVLQNFFYD